jgi:hypothetical protein
MKPVERSSYHNLYVLVQQSSTGSFSLVGTGATVNGLILGTGVYLTMSDAQNEQTVQLLKGNHVEVFHLEYPNKFAK